MDDQRTSLPPLDEKARSSSLAEDDDLFDVLCRIQGARLNDQRAVLPPHSMSASEDDAGGENVQEDVFAQVSGVAFNTAQLAGDGYLSD